MTPREAKAVEKWFKRTIGLSDWNIDLSIGDPQPELGHDIPPSERDEWLGRCGFRVDLRRACVWVNTSAHTIQQHTSPTCTLFHEMIHCFFGSCGMDSHQEAAEYAVNQLASALELLYEAQENMEWHARRLKTKRNPLRALNG